MLTRWASLVRHRASCFVPSSPFYLQIVRSVDVLIEKNAIFKPNYARGKGVVIDYIGLDSCHRNTNKYPKIALVSNFVYSPALFIWTHFNLWYRYRLFSGTGTVCSLVLVPSVLLYLYHMFSGTGLVFSLVLVASILRYWFRLLSGTYIVCSPLLVPSVLRYWCRISRNWGYFPHKYSSYLN